jgi:16S rRNA A1518/A1519 N6-dimethyltransferase RsmA/KsgA/DIM1 with predicted DNA glycosylase/AP lyase activity
MYLGVKEAIEELEIKTEIYTLEDIKNTFNPKLKIRDFFKIKKEFLKNSLIFDNLPYNLTITIIEYILKLNKVKYNINFALACAGFTGNSFINKYDLLYIYLANARFYDKNGKNEHIFPTIILTNDIDKLTSNQKKKTNSQKIEVFRNKKILSTTDVFSLLKYFDIKKENIIKLSNEFYGGIKIKGFNDIVCK